MSHSKRGHAVVGVSAFGHDAAAALVHSDTGEVLAAVSEERLSGRKHDSRFPAAAIRSMLIVARRLGLDVSSAAVAHDPAAFINDALPRQLSMLGPNDQRLRSESVRWFEEWRRFHQHVADEAGRLCGAPVITVPHHLAHAATAYFGSGVETATIVTLDGQGEADTGGVFLGSHGTLHRVATSWWPHSLGALYLAATAHLGFGLGDEGIVMGMSAYGRPRFSDLFLGAISVSKRAEISFIAGDVIDIRMADDFPYFVVALGERVTRDVQIRRPGDALESPHFDLAASLQHAIERVGVDLVRAAIALTGARDVALAGGVCLNACMNQRIREDSGCRDLFVFPASGDDGTALGAALVAAHVSPRPRQALSCFLGATSPEASVAILERRGVNYRHVPNVIGELATELAAGKAIGRFTGAAEFGPRALGHRSILADPRQPVMRDLLNAHVKRRESFRPFAPICPIDDAAHWFAAACAFPHMTEVVDARDATRAQAPAAVHVDGSARLQTVAPDDDRALYDLLKAFGRISGVPILINTSFNRSGEPLVHHLEDAIDSFLVLGLDLLWVDEDLVVTRSANPHLQPPASLDELLQARRWRNRGLLEPAIEIDLSTPAAIRRFHAQ